MKNIISTKKAPAAVGPYSQAVKACGLVFISGQIPLDPATGVMVEGDIEVQTKRVLDNIAAIIEASELTLESVVKCTCFLKNMGDFEKFNATYQKYFSENPPARECVEVSKLPKDAAVEISAILKD